MLQALKNRYRRWQMDRRGLVPDLTIPTLTAGDRSGVWTVCPLLLGPESVVYSFGVGNNLAWDLSLVGHFGLTVHAFDPTPASIEWVAEQSLPEGLVFHPLGLAGHDGSLPFHLPRRGSRFNFRSVSSSVQSGTTVVEAPVRRLSTLMRQLGHERIDVLKLDIEGGEYAALEDLLAGGIVVPQILVEFHHHFPGLGVARTEQAIRALRKAGYRIFHRSPRGLEFSFLSSRQ